MPADKLERIGVVVNRVTGVDSVISAASQAEALRYGTAWLTNGGPEDCVPSSRPSPRTPRGCAWGLP